MRRYLCILVLIASIVHSFSYKPVVLLHGILSGADSMSVLKELIEELHPGTMVYNCDKFSGWNSLENAWRQVEQIRDYIDEIGKAHPEGIIFLASFLHLIFPDLAAKTAFELFYSRVGQHTSVGGYWNDPFKQSLYMKYSEFLPVINNEKISTNSTDFKKALVRLEKMVMVGGPNDDVITPWESSHFGYFNEDLDVVEFNKRKIFTADLIGLKTLLDADKLKIIVKPRVHHLSWHRQKDVIKEVIMPYLD
ncbi:lysosomal thioesterase PPT2 homolog isoform X2 [Drosophila willistoni]|uniref:lysosomal thioesterase PPT2 homolog isoform X2 n=1 Tax=Drosophila willistoni TaxID=7260 RepID=UPI001F07E1CF|nr:lysosomal thioesterase PPT2 homolog isoform X2 [Drosophila willistoni]